MTMRRVVLFFFILATALFMSPVSTVNTQNEYQNLEKDNGLSRIINLMVPGVLKGILAKNYTLIKPASIVIPKIFHFIAQGSLNLTDDLKIWGLASTNTSNMIHADGTDEVNKTSLWLDLPIKEMGISLGYEADLSILNKIPIYGKGDLVIAVSKIEFNLSMYLHSPQAPNYLPNISASDMHLNKLSFHPSHSYITGFWKNVEADNLVSEIMNLAESVLMLFAAAEKDCLICVVDPVIEYVVNKIILKQEASLIIDCPCLKDVYDDIYTLEEVLEDTVSTFFDGDYESVFLQLLSKDLLDFYARTFEKMYDYAEKGGFLHKIRKQYDFI